MARSDRVPFLPGRRLVVVRATINDQEQPALLVDSGAQQSAISRRVAAALALDLLHPLRFAPLVGVGRTAPMPVVAIRRIQVGASTVANLEVTAYDLPPLFGVDGILGVDFLHRFRVTLEFDTRTLVLRPPPARRP
jgi:predicted aspartyl protease